MISIDVEAQPKRAENNHIDRLIYGRFGQEEYGIGRLFDIAEKHNARLTCFLDYAEQHVYGDELLDVGRYIASRGHDLQVHLHPEFLSSSLFEKTRTRRQNDLFAVDREQADILINYVVQTHSEITAKSPVAFRGGGYRYNNAVLAALRENNFHFNSCYNPARANQPFNIGPVKQFQWEENITELPISCVPNFKNINRFYEYNFNGDLLFRGSVEDCIRSHELFLQTFFRTYGDDAVAVLVMHSWSLLEYNEKSGFYDGVRQDAADKFSALVEMYNKNYTVVTAESLSKQEELYADRIETWKSNSISIEDKTEEEITCDICGDSIKNFKEHAGVISQCGTCKGMERQRTFARLLKSEKMPFELSGKRILHISPSVSERRIFGAIKNAQITTLSLRAEEKPDIAADICSIPQIADKSFDVVFASHVLVHVHDLQAALKELSRILTDDGIFISYEPINAGKMTRRLSDIGAITQHYGKEAYEKYRLGRFSIFGDLDIDAIFSSSFERSKFYIRDMVTSTVILWNVWQKVRRRRPMSSVDSEKERNAAVAQQPSPQETSVPGQPPVKFPYESLQKVVVTPEIIRRCERILADGWDRDGCFTPLHSIPWKLRPGDSRSFNFHIHCLDMCEQLLLAFSSGGPQKFFDAAARVALEWCGRYCGERNGDDSPYIWYDMSVGMRAFRLAYIYDVLRQNNAGGREDRELIWQSLLEHRRYLEDDANIAFHSNHGFYQLIGQLVMGRRLTSYDPSMRELYARGQECFARMLRTQFTEEGIQRENSPDYQRMLLLTLRGIIESGLIQDSAILAFTDRIEHTLSSFICPDQTMLQLGDSDARNMAASTKTAALSKWSEAAMQYMASGGKIGKAPEEGLQAYPQSGYAVVRTYGKAFPATFQDQSYLAFNAAFHSRTHRHADDLTLTWYDRGQHILVDSGRYGYVGKTEKGSPLWQDGFWYSDPFRVYCESTRAHNTLEFDGRNNPRRGAPMYGSALQRWKEQDGIFAVEAELRLFKTIRRARTLLFRPGAWLLIADWFHDNAGEPHTVRQWFHTAPHLTMQPEADGWRCDLDGGTSLQVTSLLAEMRPMPVIRGQESPEHQGWCSRQPLEKTPNDAFGYEMRERPSGNFATLFTFSAAQADRQWSQVNSSGRRGRFRWKDADGVHSIMLERPAEGELTFSHTIAK